MMKTSKSKKAVFAVFAASLSCLMAAMKSEMFRCSHVISNFQPGLPHADLHRRLMRRDVNSEEHGEMLVLGSFLRTLRTKTLSMSLRVTACHCVSLRVTACHYA